MTIAALFILVFFTVYAASCFVTVGKLFSTLFDIKYQYMMIAGALFVIGYTFIGLSCRKRIGFHARNYHVFSLVAVLFVGVTTAGGIDAVIANVQQIPGFFDFFGIANPKMVDGIQQVSEFK